MPNVSLRDLLDAGVHFGHQTRRWNPRMRPYIYGAKNGVHIINLQRTARLLRDEITERQLRLEATGIVGAPPLQEEE